MLGEARTIRVPRVLLELVALEHGVLQLDGAPEDDGALQREQRQDAALVALRKEGCLIMARENVRQR